MSSKKSGSSSGSGISPSDFARDQYYHVLTLNWVVLGVVGLLSIPMASWYIHVNYFHDSIMDRIGLSLSPIFFFTVVALPLIGVWLWIAFERVPRRQRRWLLPVLAVIFDALYAIAGILVSWGFIEGALWAG